MKMLIEQMQQPPFKPPIKEVNVLAPYRGGNPLITQVAAVICKRPSRESLCELLRLVDKQQSVEVTMEAVKNGPKRSKLYKTLRVQVSYFVRFMLALLFQQANTRNCDLRRHHRSILINIRIITKRLKYFKTWNPSIRIAFLH